MNQELEIEFKNLLTESEYSTLLTYFNFAENNFFTQENYYFDTPDFQLKEKSAALRIRMKDAHAEITLKTPQGDHLLETNQTISIEEAEKMIKNKTFVLPDVIQQTLVEINISSSSVHLHTTLKTKRAEKKVERELVVLDQSWYGDQTDYELEVETDDPERGERFFLSVLKQFSIPKRETPNKIQRAFDL